MRNSTLNAVSQKLMCYVSEVMTYTIEFHGLCQATELESSNATDSEPKIVQAKMSGRGRLRSSVA